MYKVYHQIFGETPFQYSGAHWYHSRWAWTLVFRRGTSINSISLGSPLQLKFTLRTSRAVDIGIDCVNIWPRVRVMFLTSCRRCSTRRHKAVISGKESQRWWMSLIASNCSGPHPQVAKLSWWFRLRCAARVELPSLPLLAAYPVSEEQPP